MYSLSPSNLSLYLDCPRCFWLQFNRGLKRPDGIFPSLPGGMDRILKDHFDAFIGRDALPPELARHGLRCKLFSERRLLEEWRNWRRGLSWKDPEGNILRGAVDNLLEAEGGKLVVLDFKTRGSAAGEGYQDHYVHQLDCYAFLLEKSGRAVADYAYLLIYHPDKVVEGAFLFHADLQKVAVSPARAEGLFTSALALLKSAMPPAAKGCGYCKYRESRIGSSLLDFQA